MTDILVPLYYGENSKNLLDSNIVEIDESKFGKRKYNRGHPVEGVWILGMIERSGEKKVKLFQVEKRDKCTLTNLISQNFDTNTTVYTDGWRGYSGFSEKDSNHQTVNHSKNFVDPETGAHTNTFEGTWNGIKVNVPHRCWTKKLINPFLVRYMITKNEKDNVFKFLVKLLFEY